jgi:hypothetical protein
MQSVILQGHGSTLKHTYFLNFPRFAGWFGLPQQSLAIHAKHEHSRLVIPGMDQLSLGLYPCSSALILGAGVLCRRQSLPEGGCASCPSSFAALEYWLPSFYSYLAFGGPQFPSQQTLYLASVCSLQRSTSRTSPSRAPFSEKATIGMLEEVSFSAHFPIIITWIAGIFYKLVLITSSILQYMDHSVEEYQRS